jgi:outer membrane murein-binding lipoprotein Lpp
MERRMARTRISLLAASILASGLLAGCAQTPAPSQADQANVASCTAQADAVYQQDNLNGLARTSQNGLLYAPMPNQVFDAQRMGTMNARDNQISDCVANGNPNNRPLAAAPLPAPQIIGNP